MLCPFFKKKFSIFIYFFAYSTSVLKKYSVSVPYQKLDIDFRLLGKCSICCFAAWPMNLPWKWSWSRSSLCFFSLDNSREKCLNNQQKKQCGENFVSGILIKQKLWLAHILIKNILIILHRKKGLWLTKMSLPFPLETLWQRVVHFWLWRGSSALLGENENILERRYWGSCYKPYKRLPACS